jgi:ribosomal protein L37AE/L43A
MRKVDSGKMYRDLEKKFNFQPQISSSVGPGWVGRLETLLQDLQKLNYDLKGIVQIKEKFGSLRFYINGATEEQYQLVNQAEKETEKICEECGHFGKIRPANGWWKCRCDACQIDYLQMLLDERNESLKEQRSHINELEDKLSKTCSCVDCD